MDVTPMMQQYNAVKAKNPDALLLFRLGDFYELFGEDAKVASQELNLTLTSRYKDKENAAMCGVPHHAVDSYINKLVSKGYKVAIAEQIGDPKAKGLTKRELIKVVTPGTVLSDAALSDTKNNYLVLLSEVNDAVWLTGADISTGECFYGKYAGQGGRKLLTDELYRLMPSELLLLGELSFRDELGEFLHSRLPCCVLTAAQPAVNSELRLKEHFADGQSLPETAAGREAVAALLDYLHATAMTDLSHIATLTHLGEQSGLLLDVCTLRNLEITHNLRDGGKNGTLYGILDQTGTAMGSRLLKKWLEQPLTDIAAINNRLTAVEELKQNFNLRRSLRESMRDIRDLERLLTRIETESANGRDLVALKVSLACLPAVKRLLGETKATLLTRAAQNIGLYEDLTALLKRAIVDEPALGLHDGGIIKDGYNAELDEYRRLSAGGKQMLQEIETREREKTGIKSLKISYNKVFGYYIEVRHSGKELVPSHYIRKQTLVNAERYVTEELKEFETKILGAQEKIYVLEYSLFSDIRLRIKNRLADIQRTARELAAADVLTALAETADKYNYVRPVMTDNGGIEIRDGRHPLVENLLTEDMFVPNDTSLNHHATEIMIITGPNMAGKSTYMRQVAVITVMAQAGSFIPARQGAISPVDRIFTRIGASDDLAGGQSTFMLEMNEVATILKYATKNSLIILDEVGRGTSTFDGMSIAKACLEHIYRKIHAKTLFATHYHELTDMAEGKIKNFCVAVKERGKDLTFLRRIVPGSADKSYGIQVARLAGLPKTVTERAETILAELETDTPSSTHVAVSPEPVSFPDNMPSIFASSLRERLLALDVMSLTPLEALNELYKLKEEAKREAGET